MTASHRFVVITLCLFSSLCYMCSLILKSMLRITSFLPAGYPTCPMLLVIAFLLLWRCCSVQNTYPACMRPCVQGSGVVKAFNDTFIRIRRKQVNTSNMLIIKKVIVFSKLTTCKVIFLVNISNFNSILKTAHFAVFSSSYHLSSIIYSSFYHLSLTHISPINIYLLNKALICLYSDIHCYGFQCQLKGNSFVMKK